MLEPKDNPNPSIMVDPPAAVRHLMAKQFKPVTDSALIAKARDKAERERVKQGAPHRVDYFHQLDDPYSHLSAQLVKRFADRYEIELVPHLVRASGGKNQPEFEKLAVWARRDCGLIAPHYGLGFPETTGTVPDPALTKLAARILAGLGAAAFLDQIEAVSTALWAADEAALQAMASGAASDSEAEAALDQGSARLADLNHYSGAMFFYGGEWYWGADRLFHLEQRLRDLGAGKTGDEPFLVARPSEDVSGVDASALTLDFYPSLNSPYTSIIYDRTLKLKDACGVRFHHKPVLPMIMRGVPATRAKGFYIFFDTKREADWFGVPFGPCITPIGTPTRRAYSLMGWAREQGKDEALMSSLLRHAFAMGVGLHRDAGMKKAVEAAGLDWAHAKTIIGNDGWKDETERYQNEMVEGLGLWGVPSYRLSGPDGEPDLAVWGQDRLWLVAAEIRRRAALPR